MPLTGYACRYYLKMPLSSEHRLGISLDRRFSVTDFPIVINRIRRSYAGIPCPSVCGAHWRLSHRMPSPGRKFWAPRIIGNRFRRQPPPYSGRGTSMPASCRIATRALVEILGLDPYQSETQYLEEKFRVPTKRKQSEKLFPLCFLFISTSGHICLRSGNIAEIFFHFRFHSRITHRQ